MTKCVVIYFLKVEVEPRPERKMIGNKVFTVVDDLLPVV